MSIIYTLSQLGWSPFFQQQLSLDEWQTVTLARVVAQYRSRLTLLTEAGEVSLPITPALPSVTVGDWLLLSSQQRFVRALAPFSRFSRRAPGSELGSQLIAANVDTLLVVSSLNADFNLNRIERYLALAHEAGAEPVVVLTKVDLIEASQGYIRQVQALDPFLAVVAVNALDAESVQPLRRYCGVGKTVAMLGSSGVGKSTLLNSLLGTPLQATGEIRADDEKGRHTTTARSLHPLADGGLLLDTPGMRELQLAACETGVRQTFSEIDQLGQGCRFADCAHQDEPGCAVRAAVAEGELDARRLANHQKLMREQALNASSLAEKRAKDRDLGRFYRTAKKAAKQRKRGG